MQKFNIFLASTFLQHLFSGSLFYSKDFSRAFECSSSQHVIVKLYCHKCHQGGHNYHQACSCIYLHTFPTFFLICQLQLKEVALHIGARHRNKTTSMHHSRGHGYSRGHHFAKKKSSLFHLAQCGTCTQQIIFFRKRLCHTSRLDLENQILIWMYCGQDRNMCSGFWQLQVVAVCCTWL